MLLSPHFDDSELCCKCGCGLGLEPGDLDPDLLVVLEAVHFYFGHRRVFVNDYGGSCCRCAIHNKEIGGSVNSQHIVCRAADIKVEGVAPDRVADFCEILLANGGVGRYPTFTHLDVRGHKARWDKRPKEK